MLFGFDAGPFNDTVSAGTLMVALIVGGATAYFRVKINARTEAERVWQGEHHAQKERADRLQREKDEQQLKINDLGGQVRDLQIQVAELKGRPDLAMLQNLVETQAHAGHETSMALMAQIASHDQRGTESVNQMLDSMRTMSQDVRHLITVLERRETKFRHSDEAGDQPGMVGP